MTYIHYATYSYLKHQTFYRLANKANAFPLPLSLYDLSIIQTTKQQAHKPPLPATTPAFKTTIDFKLIFPYSDKGNMNLNTKSIQTTTPLFQSHFLKKQLIKLALFLRPSLISSQKPNLALFCHLFMKHPINTPALHKNALEADSERLEAICSLQPTPDHQSHKIPNPSKI